MPLAFARAPLIGAAFALALPMALAAPAQALPMVETEAADAVLFGDYLDVYANDGQVTDAPAPEGLLEIVLTGFASVDGTVLDEATISLLDDGDDWLSGELSGFAYIENAAGVDELRLTFGDVAGAAAASFGDTFLAVLRGEFGAVPFAGDAPLNDGVMAQMTVSAPASAVPVPAAGLLLLSGLGLTGLVARRRG